MNQDGKMLGAVAVLLFLATAIFVPAEYLMPSKPWPEWAVVAVSLVIGMCLLIAGQTRRSSPREIVAEYQTLKAALPRQRQLLQQARREKWAEHAVRSVEQELSRLERQFEQFRCCWE